MARSPGNARGTRIMGAMTTMKDAASVLKDLVQRHSETTYVMLVSHDDFVRQATLPCMTAKPTLASG
jgi:hypothetical protein